MVKALLLQQWYEASDEQLEQALWDRLSFRRFVGLGLDEDAPDRSTISRLRRTLARRGLARPLFDELNGQFEAQALVLRQGTLLDATLVEVQVRRAELQPAHVNETEVAEGLIVGDEQAVYADRAYEDKGASPAPPRRRGQGPDQTPPAQVPGPAAALAAPPQRADRTPPRSRGTRLRHAQAALRLPPCALPRS